MKGSRDTGREGCSRVARNSCVQASPVFVEALTLASTYNQYSHTEQCL
jgi:hypothetical protein